MRPVNIAISCVLAPITNTLLYLGFMTIFFQDYMIQAYNYTGKTGLVFLGWLLALVGVNAILEAASCLIIGSAITNVLWKITNKGK